MKLKVQQKLGLDAFKEIDAQIKGGGMFAIPRFALKEVPSNTTYVGPKNKIERAFNLGKKVEVHFVEDTLWEEIFEKEEGKPVKFEKVNNVYYLVLG